MYTPNEIVLSKKYLIEIFQKIEGEICLIGGWAVVQLVNENFKRNTGHDYVGSKDIDVGFHIDETWTKNELEKSDLSKFIHSLEEMKFRWQGFRLFKDFDFDTLEELTPEESSKKPQFEIIRIYVDPIVDYIHPQIKQIYGFNPIDEPILSYAFKENLFTETKIFGINIRLPHTHLLLAMKLNSVKNRNKEEKRIKDIIDIYALIWFSDLTLSELKSNLYSIYPNEKTKKTIQTFNEKDISKASNTIGIDEDEIIRIFNRFIREI